MTAVTVRTAAPVSEASELALARSGDRDAFLRLVEPHDRGLRALVYRMVRDRDRMDDALQETYVLAFRGLRRFRGDSSFSTWLYRIAYNVALGELRRSRRLHVVSFEDVREPPDRGPDPAEEVELRAGLAAAMAELSPEDRAAVVLVDAQGFDYRAAGEILGVPVGTVASRLNRARAALRRALVDEPEGDRG
jgi:RNA polymerase sigma-70 factor, ECF subfamily